MPITQETRTKMSESAKGNTNCLGKHWKVKDTSNMKGCTNGFQKGHSLGFQKGYIPWNKGEKCPSISESLKGHKHSKETRRKQSENWKGEKNPNYKGGISPINTRIRNGIEVRLWKEAVYIRDSFTCQKCGDNKGRNLIAHHIRNFAEEKELRTSIENGITFCEKCHTKFHKKYGTKNNTREQLEKFLNIKINDK